MTDTGHRIGLGTLTYPCRTCQCLWHRTYLQAWDATWMSPTTPKQEPGRAKRCGRVRTCVGCSNPPGSSNSSLLSSDPQIAPQILRLLLRSSDCSSDSQITQPFTLRPSKVPLLSTLGLTSIPPPAISATHSSCGSGSRLRREVVLFRAERRRSLAPSTCGSSSSSRGRGKA